MFCSSDVCSSDLASSVQVAAAASCTRSFTAFVLCSADLRSLSDAYRSVRLEQMALDHAGLPVRRGGHGGEYPEWPGAHSPSSIAHGENAAHGAGAGSLAYKAACQPSVCVYRRQAFHRVFLHRGHRRRRSEEHTSELQSLMRISYAVFCLK